MRTLQALHRAMLPLSLLHQHPGAEARPVMPSLQIWQRLLVQSAIAGMTGLREELEPVRLVTHDTWRRGPSVLDHLSAKWAVSMMTLADAAAATLPEGVTDAAGAAGSAVQSATDAAASTITKKDNGWFGFLTGPLESVLKVR